MGRAPTLSIVFRVQLLTDNSTSPARAANKPLALYPPMKFALKLDSLMAVVGFTGSGLPCLPHI